MNARHIALSTSRDRARGSSALKMRASVDAIAPTAMNGKRNAGAIIGCARETKARKAINGNVESATTPAINKAIDNAAKYARKVIFTSRYVEKMIALGKTI